MSPYLLAGGVLTFIGVWWGTGWVRSLAAIYQIFDYPNQRNLHHQPIPKGGGAVVVLSLALGIAFWQLGSGKAVPLSLVGATGLLWITSVVEDYWRVPIKLRLPLQLLAGFWIVVAEGPFETLPLPEPLNLSLGSLTWPVNLFWILALTNAFNFMDGIDGLAASHTGLVGGALVILDFGGLITGLAFLGAIAGLAFLRWNKEPARIFLGDSGAIPLGFLFAAMPYYSTHPSTSQSVLLMALLFGLFFFDTGFTLIRRLLRKEPIWEAHRSHLYQRLVLAGFRHTWVTLMLILGSTCLIGITLISHFFGLTLWLPVLASLCFGTVYWQYTLSREKSYYR